MKPIKLHTLRFLPLILLAVLLTACGSSSVMQASSWPGVAVQDEVAYVSFGPFVRAISLPDGKALWTYPQEEQRGVTFFAPPAVSQEDDVLVVGSYSQVVYGLRASKPAGSPLWTFEEPEDRVIGGALISGGRAYVPTALGRLWALDLRTGEPAWRQPFEAKHAIWSAPLTDNGHIYVASLDHHLYALDAESGAVAWELDLGTAISDTPALADGLLLCGTFGGQLYAVDAQTGDIRWTFAAEDAIWGNPAVNGELAFFGDVSATAYALKLATGEEVWRQTLESSASASPTTAGERVYFVSEAGAVDAFDKASGDPAWPSSAKVTGRLLADPILTEYGLLVPAMESECLLYMVDADSGSVRCLFSPK